MGAGTGVGPGTGAGPGTGVIPGTTTGPGPGDWSGSDAGPLAGHSIDQCFLKIAEQENCATACCPPSSEAAT